VRGPLTEAEFTLLREVVRKHRPALLELTDLIGRVPLDDAARGKLRDAVGHEIMESGYLGTDSSRARGLELDDIIDKLGIA
jgi:hypothetical protein